MGLVSVPKVSSPSHPREAVKDLEDVARPGSEPDGRRARRDRNKVAVVDAYLEFIREGVVHPSVADVAARSGVSHRSVFRYFADRDEMARTSIERQQERLAPLIDLDVDPTLPLNDRVDQLLKHRLSLFEEIAPTARLTRSLAGRQPLLAEQVTRMRRAMRRRVREIFAPELEAMTATKAADVLAVLDVLTSFESVELLRYDQSLSKPKAAQALRHAILALLRS